MSVSYIYKVLFGISWIILAGCNSPHSSETHNSDWTLLADESGMTYITIKNGDIGEINTFRTIDGKVSADGEATFTIALDSVDSAVESRDERMRNILFETADFPMATATSQIDMATLNSLGIGESETVLLDLSINLHNYIYEDAFYVLVTRLGENKVVVANKAPLILDATDFGFGPGLKDLQSLAGLDSISPVVPVTVSLVFTR